MDASTRSTLESRLCLLAQTGDREALDALLRSVQLDLHRYIARIVRERDLADDVLQDVLVQICRKLRWLREPAMFRSWSFRIAHRRALRTLQRRRRRPRTLDDDALKDAVAREPDESAFAAELVDRLPELLRRLSPASSTVIVLHYLEQNTLSEIANILGVPLGTVKSRLAYGLERLRSLGLRYIQADT